MSELIINIDAIDPIDFFGVNNAKIGMLKTAFPKIKLTSRGNKIKIIGSKDEVALIGEKIEMMIEYLHKNGTLPEQTIEELINGAQPKLPKTKDAEDIINYGPNGIVAKAKTANQRKMVTLVEKNDIVFAIGPAGTGKTYTAVALAVRALKNKLVKKIILARPAVEAGETLGFLPGDIKEKVDPYLRPLYDALDDMIPLQKLNYYMQNRMIEIAPLAFMRGRTLDNSFIILDEAQNTTELQIKMFLTRLGPTAKCIITGDLTQIDLPFQHNSGLLKALDILKDIDGIAEVYLTEADVIRHKLVKKIINAYAKEDKKKGNKNKNDRSHQR